MDRNLKARYRARARVLKALAHPTRLFIVDEISRKARCVRELTAMVGDDISTVSRHLAVLRSAGLVADQRRGAQVFYSLRVPCALNFFSCVESVLKVNAREQAAWAKKARG